MPTRGSPNRTMRRRGLSGCKIAGSVSCSIERPVIYIRYEGTRDGTQGERTRAGPQDRAYERGLGSKSSRGSEKEDR
jgi:hypothetical protein